MTKTLPVKRADALRPLSHDHHHGLLLSWKIRTGFRKGIDPARIKKYADWVFAGQLQPHFEIEEEYVFPILGEHNELTKRALAEHRKIRRLFQATTDMEKNLVLIEEKLEGHIRFEERVLFNEVQQVASPAELERIAAVHTPTASLQEGEWEDEFWK
ncbi:MAG TPA: hemerythrin domain-containing protein [Cyclobacteriaceae bacterium]|nr:hemerythrin domain-containing protein [Cyclobacteriaceae bacterium]MCB9238341.1 hemerythrin domain-containing protein [Flammeovirgaceae bacterium]MCB0499065.1 hemerythrin domain-containing protein [Cyclobacteriaceae bacterium]MCO5272023.1 hemerythrin domain-containing protein [Cyclobacteriaceae bacterium]MCW5902941.1 hemerythrin domain-containing protein [Cyclobacteriaceae bacterium]